MARCFVEDRTIDIPERVQREGMLENCSLGKMELLWPLNVYKEASMVDSYMAAFEMDRS